MPIRPLSEALLYFQDVPQSLLVISHLPTVWRGMKILMAAVIVQSKQISNQEIEHSNATNVGEHLQKMIALFDIKLFIQEKDPLNVNFVIKGLRIEVILSSTVVPILETDVSNVSSVMLRSHGEMI
jgi:hypothetical protein